jgi:formyl-CoA transferase
MTLEHTTSNIESNGGPLEGYRVLELGNLIAAPSGAKIFAEFGAEVIKVERPRIGDELRRWRLFRGDNSLLWYTLGRNKKSITLDLGQPRGQELALRLAEKVDVVLENFRPGTLEKWNLGPEDLRNVNPDLVVVRISGYGQSGPYRDRPGFGGIAEALGGIRNLTGYPGLPPTRVGVSLGDTVAGLFGVIGALMSLLHRERGRLEGRSEQRGEVVDVALYEAVFALLEGVVPEYDGYGVVRERTGNSLPGIAPSNTYRCRDESWVVIGGNGDAIFPRLMRAVDRPDLADDPELQDNPGRARHQEMLDKAIEAWTSERALDEVMDVMVRASVPAGPIYDASDIVKDPHFEAREMLQERDIEVESGHPETVRFPGVIPRLDRHPGSLKWCGPRLGEHNDEVYRGLLGLDSPELNALIDEGVV